MKKNKLYQQCKPYTLLLVEDHTPLREIICEIFEPYFDTLISAKDGQEALEYYLQFQKEYNKYIDIVVTDINMPYKDGLELTRDIKKHNPKQTIIIISAYTQSNQLLDFINIGINYFFTKPVKPIKLLDYIESITYKLPAPSKVNEAEAQRVYLSDDLYWDRVEKVLVVSDQIMQLSQNESIIMKILVEKVNFVYSIEDIIDIFYNQEIYIDENKIRTTIFRLRKKLPEDSIKAHYGRGYSLQNI
jgi:DNA-binding response OmpR family regulator